jgi:SAM-dependent methyltransferase
MPPPGLLPVAIVSAAVLAYEVLLVRLFSIVQWHHFAYMIISIALLGFGASGTLLALARRPLVERFGIAFPAGAALFGVAAILSFALAERLPFNALEIVWDPGQLVHLFASYALLTPPFIFGGACIGLAFARFPDAIGRVYAYDLVGAGAGALGIVGALFLLTPPAALRLTGALGLAAAALSLLQAGGGRGRWSGLALAAASVGVALWLPPSWTALRMSEFKGLSIALTVPDARVIEERSSPLGLLSVVESPTIPFRHAPGLSLNNAVEPPPQLGVFTDGDALSAITAYDGDPEAVRYLDYTTAALPYHLLERPEVLVLGAGGGEQVLLALYHEAAGVHAVEVNPQFVDLVQRSYADFAGRIYDRPEVTTHLAEARGFVARTDRRFDLIQLPLLDSFGATAAGVHSLHESYIYTVEAFRDYLRALRPGGMLAVTRWLKLPPRDALRLFATALEALEGEGVAEPARRLALIRSWQTTTLLVRNGPFTPEDIGAIRTFAADRSFDVAYHPGIAPAEANRYNVLDRPYFYEGALALIGPERAAYLDRYKFQIAPATDDRPYFFDFFKWRALPELLALRAQGGAAMLDWGYLILVATLVQAAALSLVLILLPLWVRRRRFGGAAPRAPVALYFLALGLAFLFIEIAFIQRFILFLGHPLYAVAVVLAGFLVFAGLGSAAAPRLARALDGAGGGEPDAAPAEGGGAASGSRPGRRRRYGALELAAGAIALLAVLYLLALPTLFGRLMPLPDAAKVGLSLTLIAPLAFLMGMPFPLGLTRVAAWSPDLVPWAWAINGCASVLSAILAALLAAHLGFTAVVAIAAALYLAAPAALRRGGRAGVPARAAAGDD